MTESSGGDFLTLRRRQMETDRGRFLVFLFSCTTLQYPLPTPVLQLRRLRSRNTWI